MPIKAKKGSHGLGRAVAVVSRASFESPLLCRAPHLLIDVVGHFAREAELCHDEDRGLRALGVEYPPWGNLPTPTPKGRRCRWRSLERLVEGAEGSTKRLGADTVARASMVLWVCLFGGQGVSLGVRGALV
jgi:hypothetical protein